MAMSDGVRNARYHAQQCYRLWMTRAIMCAEFSYSQSNNCYVYENDSYVIFVKRNGAIWRSMRKGN